MKKYKKKYEIVVRKAINKFVLSIIKDGIIKHFNDQDKLLKYVKKHVSKTVGTFEGLAMQHFNSELVGRFTYTSYVGKRVVVDFSLDEIYEDGTLIKLKTVRRG